MENYTRLRAEIDLDAIAHNIHAMEKASGGSSITLVIKADGYGHGALPIARIGEQLDCVHGYATATAEEGVALREKGIRKPIMLLGYAFPESYPMMITHEIRACVFDLETAEALQKAALACGKDAIIHIALDTGMSRIGFPPTAESADTIRRIAALPGIRLEGLFTHFARADEKDLASARAQLARYELFLDMLAERGVQIPIRHCCNSAAIFRLPEAHFDMVRAGITLYGLMPSAEIAESLPALAPAMSLVSHISYVKHLPAGAEVSYGGTYTAPSDRIVATIPAGYADGYPRTLSGRGAVLIHGRLAPILGRVCMDQFMVDVTDIPDVKRGDEAVLLGKQGSERISAEEIGDLSGRFNYELVCDISKRVPRLYLKDGHPFDEVDYF